VAGRDEVGGRAEARNFAVVWDLQGTILLDETGRYADRLGIRGVPFNLVMDSAGLVRAAGVTTPRELHEAVDSLLAES
jgi:hypothetical protein